MKKYLVFTTLLIVLLFSYSIVAAEIDVGYLSNWRFNQNLCLSLYGGVQPPNPYGGIKVLYNLDEKNSGLYFLLQGEIDTSGMYASWMYNWPVEEDFDLQVGYKSSFVNGGQLQNILLRGYYHTPYGQFQLGSQVGSGDEQIDVQYLYSLEKLINERLQLKGELGVKYLWTESQSNNWYIPASLEMSYHVLKNTSVNFKVDDCYNVSAQQNKLAFTFYVQNDFDFRRRVEDKEKKEVTAEVKIDKPFTVQTVVEEVVAEVKVVVKDEEKVLKETENKESRPEVIIVNKPAKKVKPDTYYDFENRTLWHQGKALAVDSYQDNDTEHVYLPIRQTIESIGGEVYWDEEFGYIYIVFNGVNLLIDPTNREIHHNGKRYELNQSAQFKDGHFFMEVTDLLNYLLDK